MPNYSDQEILSRMKGGPDAKREQSFEKAYGQFQQTHDPAMVDQMAKWAGMVPGFGAATPDAKNAARMYLAKMTGGTPEYMGAGDAEGMFHGAGNILGKALRIAAPIAGMAIPGLGFAGAALMGGLGNAGGQLISGGKFNPMEALGAGAGAGFGNKLLGNGLGSGETSWGFGSHMPAGFGNMTAMGNAGGVGGGGGYQLPGSGMPHDPGMSGNPQGGLLDKIFGGGSWLDKGMQGIGMFGAIKGQHDATQSMNHALEGAQNEWNTRQPLRDMAISGIQGLGNLQAPDMTNVFADQGNPFYHAPLTPSQRPVRY